MKKKLLPWLILLCTPVVLGLCLLAGASKLGIPDLTVLPLRQDRVLAGFIVGAALAAAGTVFQALLRNPLAEPYVLGVSSGAGVGAAAAILTGVAASSLFALPLSAFLFAAVTLGLVYSLASNRGRVSIYGLILSGVIVSAVCSSILMFLVTLAPFEGLHTILWWMLGSLDVSFRPLLLTGFAVIAVSIVAAWLLAPELNALSLGHDMAHYVGVRTRLAITAGLALATFITATSVALAGLIGFVGLVVPHVARSLVGPDHRRLIPVAALGGGMFLAVCDALARVLLMPQEIPVGVITALIGGPFFLVILRQRRKRGWIE